MDASVGTNYLVVNGVLLGVAVSLHVACVVRHVRNPLQHVRPLQTLFLRLDVLFAVFAVLFYVRVFFAENPHAVEPLAQLVFPLLEGLVIFSFFNMMVLLVGGTAAAVARMDNTTDDKHVQGGGSTITWTSSPSKKVLDRYRHRLILFIVFKPILGAVDGWVVNHEDSATWYHKVHSVIAIGLVILTCLTFVGVLRTYLALKTHIPPSFHLTIKFLVIKAMLIVSTFQWAIANVILSSWSTSQLYIYGTVCMVEGVAISLGFYLTFTGHEEDVPRLPATAAPFRVCSVAAIWDLLAYPLVLDPTKKTLVLVEKPTEFYI
ncbi:Aste57867_3048 [Aphanomyces stellatus]|uniref:Aste57867_3048 protein n=1 Tax=Aphanomyces stellatus TaxID=120398 RepID=A0A485K9K2_9STRA|nr:hypothetical protein As57867_003039 [Aphanomyces stellatus]VFT80228.1 Aste57867_3048 [Aphanomyces stellatus]